MSHNQPNARPDASQWNIVLHWACLPWVCVGHVDFMLFISFLLSLGTQSKRSFCWNMGLRRKKTFYVLPEMLSSDYMLDRGNEESGNISAMGASLLGEYTFAFYSK